MTKTIGIAVIVFVAGWMLAADAAQSAAGPATQPSTQPTKELVLDLGNKATMKLVQIPAGKFLIGSPKDEKGRETDEAQHEVTIDKPFYIGVYTVTQAQWKEVMGTTVVQQRDKSNKSWKLYGEGANNPMYYVSREEAMEFCKKLSEKTGKTVTLPTEAQWEYACRAESKTRFGFGDDDGDLGNYAWYGKNSGGKTHPVGLKKPNAWGLYDMHGNVWQWCSDWSDKDYPLKPNRPDLRGQDISKFRVVRGGSWFHGSPLCRSACRRWVDPALRVGLNGFRVVVSAEGGD